MNYKINEIYSSIQGEGAQVGRPVVIVRVSGCNLVCRWCDTDYTSFNTFSLEEVVEKIEKFKLDSVLITGGEPTLQQLGPLVDKLQYLDYWVGLETNGTNEITARFNYITISPKYRGEIDKSNFLVNEVRVAVDPTAELNDLTNWIISLESKLEADYWFLSPVEENGQFHYGLALDVLHRLRETQESKVDWLLSLQIHKLTGLP